MWNFRDIIPDKRIFAIYGGRRLSQEFRFYIQIQDSRFWIVLPFASGTTAPGVFSTSIDNQLA